MIPPSYAVPGLTLGPSTTFSAQVQDLQADLRALGYLGGSIDGMYGAGTRKAVQSLQYDLINNAGRSTSSPGDGSAPVAVQAYNDGSVTSQTGVVDQGLVGCIVAMLTDSSFPQVPNSQDPAAQNLAAVSAVRTFSPNPVPVPFLMGVLMQESECKHFQVPVLSNRDNYVTVGLDHNNTANPTAITSRGYGIGQFTFFHHPPTASEMDTYIVDPVRNVSQAISELNGKFNGYVSGSTSDTKADDRLAEYGAGPLRVCRYSASDARYLTDCVNCLKNAGFTNIVAGATPVYAGAGMTYGKTQYHEGSYSGVPVRSAIPCDWPYAIRRYNGAGVNSYDYQAEVLLRVVGGAAMVAGGS